MPPVLTASPTGTLTASSTARRHLRAEVALVTFIALGAAALRAALDLVGALTAARPLAAQTAALNTSQAPGRPLLDLGFQLVGILALAAPAGLAAVLLAAGGVRLQRGADGRWRLGREMLLGAGLAALVGGTGLALYLASYAVGGSLTVVPSGLPPVWWRLPVLLLSAAANALLEEVVVVGYLLTRLRQLGWGDGRALLVSAAVRGSYHLYQGAAGFVGNLAMGLLFGRIFQRRGRVGALVAAHFLINAVAFTGWVLLAGRLAWLPR